MADTKHWGGGTIPDSHLTPFDTTLPRPRPYTPDSAEKREPPPQRQSSPASGETLTAPTSVAWFHSVALYPDADLDQDGFVGHTVIEWDADTPSPELLVHVLIYGRDSYGQITLVGQTVDYTIYGTDPDLYWTEVFVRWQSQWDLRLELQDSWGNTLEILDFGSAPVSGPALPMNVSLEPGQVDAVFVNVTYDPPGQTGGTDWNNNGYSSGTTLLFKIQVLYDSTYTLVAEVYATDADSAGHEICIGQSFPFDVSYNNNQILGFEANPFPGVHGHWDFTINLYAYDCWTGCLLSSVPYRFTPGWTNVPLERWNEDGPLTTIFRPNPIHTLDDPSLWDEDDQLEAVPFTPQAGAYVSVALSGLLPVGGTYSLSGSYVRIYDIPDGYTPIIPDLGLPHLNPPTSADGNFPYLRDQAGFEAVMCYYYIDRNQTYVQDLGYTNACNRQVLVDPHGFNGDDVGGYVVIHPNWGQGVLVFGDGGVDNAEDADEILHEYAHAVSDNLLLGIFNESDSTQTRAMDEGFSDYWAGSWADSFYPGAFPSANVAEWDARYWPSTTPYRRQVNTTKHYPEADTGTYYDRSEIWSACLWQMMDAMGKRVADSLCLRSFELMRQWNIANPTFLVGARYALKADTLTYSAAHAVTIAQIFRDRGILPCNCPLQGDINADMSIDVFDVNGVIGIALSGDPDPQDTTCPTTRGDVNNDGVTDVFDVIYLIAAAFSGGPAPLDPCAP